MSKELKNKLMGAHALIGSIRGILDLDPIDVSDLSYNEHFAEIYANIETTLDEVYLVYSSYAEGPPEVCKVFRHINDAMDYVDSCKESNRINSVYHYEIVNEPIT